MEYSVAMTEIMNEKLRSFLLKDLGDEEICFALWNPAAGTKRFTAIIHDVIFPVEGDRQRHGNVSAYPQYVDRVKELALKTKSGIAMIHTHPFGEGHQGVSLADLHYEQDALSHEIYGVTGFPLVGMTLAGNGVWSARIYPEPFKIKWCTGIRLVGRNLKINFNPHILPPPKATFMQVRTVNVWGDEKHADIARLRVGIIGAGSVGSAVTDILARMGVSDVVILDYDKIKPHNLDRTPGAKKSDVGERKVDVVARNAREAATAESFTCDIQPLSIVENDGFRKALDCDVLFSCVDRPWPRQVLNHLAYTSLIPVIDGGVTFRTKNNELVHGMYRAQTVGPGRACLRCMGAMDAGQVQMDRDGVFDNPQYIESLGSDSSLVAARNNVIAFVYGLASLEATQFIELVTNLARAGDLGQQPYDYQSGEIIPIHHKCVEGCEYVKWTAMGDKALPVLGTDKSKQRETEV